MTPAEFRRIREKKLKLTQVQLAALMKVQPGAVSCWERGTIPISESRAAHLRLLASEKKRARARAPAA